MSTAPPTGPPSPGLLRSAAAHATASVPTCDPDQRAGEVRAGLAGTSFAYTGEAAVLRDGRLAGVLPLERLLAAGADERIADLMDADPPLIAPGVNQEVVAWRMVEHGESSLPVVAEDGSFLGLIPPRRMLSVMLDEHDRDLARLGGFLAGTRRARLAAEEPVARRLWHRLPWLLVGLAGAMLASGIMASFEEELSRVVLLAFFVPGIVYMADAVGTQTEAVIIRGLSAGVRIRSVVLREILTGVIAGVLLGAAFVAFALLAYGDAEVALGVGLSLFAACTIATVIAMALPWGFQRLGADPAFGSGPLATVIQDLLTILVYFAVATRVVL